jgi:hypothetical protein
MTHVQGRFKLPTLQLQKKNNISFAAHDTDRSSFLKVSLKHTHTKETEHDGQHQTQYSYVFLGDERAFIQ